MSGFARTVLGALSLALLRVPKRPARQVGPEHFWLGALLLVLVELAWSAWAVAAPRALDADAFRGVAFVVALVLLVAWCAAAALRRPALFWPAATLLLLLEVLIASATRGVALLVAPDWWQQSQLGLAHASWVHAAWLLLAVRRLFDYLEPFRAWPARSLTALLLALALSAPGIWLLDSVEFFYPQEWDQTGPTTALEYTPPFDAETVLGAQPQRVDAALATLAPGRPGVVDLYLVVFAGDGGEDVFRNEALYVEQLFAQRFGTAGRSLVLLNHADTVETRPLATLANLERALAGVGARADRDEDVLLLFATTHGSEDHELYVALDPLPLRQLTPPRLAAALAGSGVRHRVAIVSACYSGGYVDALRADTTLVMTAASAERTSFGCGAQSEITWFGRAYFAEALNRTASLTEAFAAARTRIAEWEEAEGNDASQPQIASAAPIEAQLARWQTGLVLGPPLAFVAPGAPVDGTDGSDGRGDRAQNAAATPAALPPPD